MKIKTFSTVVFILLLVSYSSGETVYLKDGSRVIGTIIESDATQVKMQTDIGEITIPKYKIKKISYTEEEEEKGGKGDINIQIQQQQQQQQAATAEKPPEKASKPSRNRNSLSIGPAFSNSELQDANFKTGFLFQWDSGRIVNKYVDFSGTLGFTVFSAEYSDFGINITTTLWQIPLELGIRLYPFVTFDPFKEGEETKVHILAGSPEGWSFCPYVGAGIGLLIGVLSFEETDLIKGDSDAGLGFGLYFSAGLDINIGHNFALFTELKFQGNPGKSTFKDDDDTKYDVDLSTFLWKFGVRL